MPAQKKKAPKRPKKEEEPVSEEEVPKKKSKKTNTVEEESPKKKPKKIQKEVNSEEEDEKPKTVKKLPKRKPKKASSEDEEKPKPVKKKSNSKFGPSKELVTGDSSGDGHKLTESFNIVCNLEEEALMKAFKKGEKKLGIEFEEAMSNFPAKNLPEEMVEILSEEGIPLDDVEFYKGEYFLNISNYYDIWLAIAQVGNEKMKWSHNNYVRRLVIGGYGLFDPY